jgi:hypothetical protein
MSGFFNLGVSAAGTLQTDATAITNGTSYVQVSTCAAGAGVQLPTNQKPGTIIRIRNDGVGYLVVYPQTSGQINSLTANLGFFLAANGGQAEFIAGEMIATTSNRWYTYNVVGRPQVSIATTALGTLTTQHAGCDILLPHAAATVITLPAIATSNISMDFKFIISASVANTVTISATTACITGFLFNGISAAPVTVNAAGSTNIIFANSALVGSSVSLVSIGDKWLITNSNGNIVAGACFTVS